MAINEDAKKLDELITQIDEVVTINGFPHKIIGEEDNLLRKASVKSFKPQLLRIDTDGIVSPVIDFLAKECYYFNVSTADYTLDGFTNEMIGREIKFVVFGANRFLINPSFTNIKQIGTHIKGQYNICLIDCVPDESGNALYLFRWQNESVTNYQSDGTATFTENTNDYIEQVETSTNDTLFTKFRKKLHKIGDGFISLTTATSDFVSLFVNVNSDTGFSSQRFDGTDYATISNRINSDLSAVQGSWTNKLSHLFDIYVGAFVRTIIQKQNGSKIENLVSTDVSTEHLNTTENNSASTNVNENGETSMSIVSKNGQRAFFEFDDNGYSSKLMYASGEIGIWNMVVNGDYTIVLPSSFNFLDKFKIINLSATIIQDTDSGANITYSIFRAGHIEFIDAGASNKQLKITRYAGQIFDGTFFDNEAQIRGHWTMTYSE